MPSPLTPSSSQEIIPISPPIASSSKLKLQPLPARDASSSVTLPKPRTFSPKRELLERMAEQVIAYDRRVEVQNGKRKAPSSAKDEERDKVGRMSRSQVTARMLSTLKSDVNPITHSDLYSRTDHFVSAASGHQQSNRGDGVSGQKTYWEVRTAKMEDQAREQKTNLFRGCSFYINGSTGPRVSNLQLQHLITANGGKFTGGLSGTKTQKWINGQAGRSSFKHMKVIRVDCASAYTVQTAQLMVGLLDCVEKGKRLSETDYRMIEDPSQKNLLGVFVPKSKLEAKKGES